MTIEKRGNKYRIREMREGKYYNITVDYKPTKKEAKELLEEYIYTQAPAEPTHNFEYYAKKYVEIKENVLSPSTIREYSLKIKRLSDTFLGHDINMIKTPQVQEELNLIAGKCSAKTVKDMYGFITAVLKMYQEPIQTLRVTLPVIQKKEVYIPTDKDIKRLIEASSGTRYECAIRLAAFGLRRSEICAITKSDLKGNTLYITKSMVQDKNKCWIIKDYNKTAESRRSVILPPIIIDLIKSQGYAFKGFPGTISNYIRRTQDKLGMSHFSLHKERHYFATALSEMGVPEADILKMGGWSTPHVMKSVYRHQTISKDKKRQQIISNKLNNLLE